MLQALPFIALQAHPIYAALCSFLICPLSVAIFVYLWPREGVKSFKGGWYHLALVLYAISSLWHGYIIYVGLTQGFLD